MRAGFCVDALVQDSEPLDWLPVDDVALEDFVDIIELDIAVPNALGVDNHVGAVLALVKAPGRVGSNRGLQVLALDLAFEVLAKPGAPIGVATASGVPRRASVGANKKVMLEEGHARHYRHRQTQCQNAISAFTLLSRLSILSFSSSHPLPLPRRAQTYEVS